MKFEDFIAKFEKRVKTAAGWNVCCPAHPDKTPSLQVCKAGDGKILLKCFAGCSTENVVGALGLKMQDLFPETAAKDFRPPQAAAVPATTVRPVIETIYSYTNAVGIEQYQAIRLKPKSFRQRHMLDGKWVWSMDGVERVLYRLPEVLKSEQVWIVEGEKDADNIARLGFCATCNVGGAGKWLDGYSESLAGKDVVICGDNDEPGARHVELVFESIAGKARTVRIIKLPQTAKDASDFIATFENDDRAQLALAALADSAHPFVKGIKLPIYTMGELESHYVRHVNSMAEGAFDLGKWLPTLGRKLRPLVCGELVFIIGDTGTGKTGIIQTIARAALPMPTLLFEMELPPELLFERFVANKTRMPCAAIEEAYKSGSVMRSDLETAFRGLFICSESRLNLADFENYILRSELKIGAKPKVVLIDYIQLVQSAGVNRREKVSDVAEGLKVLAKATGTIIIVASQVARPQKMDDDKEWQPTLHSAKESGSIESSCGLLLGAWRDGRDAGLMHVKVLKSTKGGGGTQVLCNFDGSRMTITERSSLNESDIPNQD